MIDAAWRSHETDAVERLRLTTDLEIRAISMIHAADWTVRYEIVLGHDWKVRTVEAESTAGGSLHVASDGQGGWTVDGVDRPDLADALDVDLVLTPFTNTLPIRRLGLEPGQSADVAVAWIDHPSLEVRRDPQRYTRLDDRRWRFESLDSDFSRDLDVDEHGLVLDYPGLFARVDADAAG
jgi:uncharacterized protein